MTTTKTPGYNSRLEIRISYTKAGRKHAHYWLPEYRGARWVEGATEAKMGRWLRMKLDVAEMAIAQDQADQVCLMGFAVADMGAAA